MKHMVTKLFARLTRWQPLDVTVLLATVIAYSVQTFSTISHWSIWFDEAFSAYIVRFNFADIAHYTSLDVHPPLYYWTLKVWTSIFGTNELGFRSLSLFFGVIAIVFSFLLMKKLFGRKAAYISALLLAVSPMLIRYGQEARMYAMVAAIAMAATYVMVIALESKKKLPWIVYGVLIAAGMWTHYFVAVVWITHWLWRAVVVWKPKIHVRQYLGRLFSRNWVGAYVLAIILYIPWMGPMFRQLFGIQTGWFWIQPVNADTLTNYLTTVIFYRQHDQVGQWLALVFVIILVVLVALTIVSVRRLKGAQFSKFMLIMSLAVVPVLLVFIASLPPLRPSFIERYLMPSVVAFSLFTSLVIAIGTAKLKLRSQIVVVALMVGSMITGVVYAQKIGNFNKTSDVSIETKSVIAEISRRSTDNEPIISRTPWVYYEAAFYNTAQHPVYYLNSTVDNGKSGSLAMLQLPGPHNITDLNSFVKQHPTVWYFGQAGGTGAAKSIHGWTVKQSFRVSDPVTGRNIYQAVEYDTRPTTE